MHARLRRMLTHPVLALGSTLFWGLVELVALNRLSRSGQ